MGLSLLPAAFTGQMLLVPEAGGLMLPAAARERSDELTRADRRAAVTVASACAQCVYVDAFI